MILVVDRKGSSLRYERDAVIVERPDQNRQRVPLNVIDQVIIHGNPMIDASFLRAAASLGLPVTCLLSHGKGADAHLGPGLASQLPFRRMQFACAFDDKCALHLARWFVSEKLDSYLLFSICPASTTSLSNALVEQLETALFGVKEAENINSLMGLEGAFASAWFSHLASAVDSKWGFSGRNRQPPKDPLNALLSLGYTLLAGAVRQVVVSEGLDPAQGFLHQDYPGREALVLDMVEPFRIGVDRMCVDLLEELGPEDFSTSESQGCRLLKEARPVFYDAWARQMELWPRTTTDGRQLRFSPLAEQIRGKIALLRAEMKACNAG